MYFKTEQMVFSNVIRLFLYVILLLKYISVSHKYSWFSASGTHNGRLDTATVTNGVSVWL